MPKYVFDTAEMVTGISEKTFINHKGKRVEGQYLQSALKADYLTTLIQPLARPWASRLPLLLYCLPSGQPLESTYLSTSSIRITS